jgi:hypothetical protein
MHGELDMNITKNLWIAAACTLAMLAGCTSGQGPSNIAGVQRIANKTAFALIVMQGTQPHPLASGASLDLQINSWDITIARPNSVGTIEQLGLKYNPGTCPVAHCVDVY